MNLIESLNKLPKERIKYDSEFKEVYMILKKVFEQDKSPAHTPTTKQEETL